MISLSEKVQARVQELQAEKERQIREAEEKAEQAKQAYLAECEMLADIAQEAGVNESSLAYEYSSTLPPRVNFSVEGIKFTLSSMNGRGASLQITGCTSDRLAAFLYEANPDVKYPALTPESLQEALITHAANFLHTGETPEEINERKFVQNAVKLAQGARCRADQRP